MSALQLAAMSVICILTLIALRVPIGVALGGVSFFGFWYLRNVNVALVLKDEKLPTVSTRPTSSVVHDVTQSDSAH